MNDEQTIYISPEDDLTTVRERLEQVQSRNVTLVVPAQTQLRSHVAWKLLNARARKLGKEVLVVSSDPQVRSVAHAVKFTVAHSLEATQQSYSKPVSRPTRANISRYARNGTPLQRSSGDTARRHSTNGLRRQSETSERSTTRGPRDSRSLREQPTPQSTDDPQRTTLLEEPASATFGAPPAQAYPSHNQQSYNDYPQYDSTPPIHPLTPEQAEEEPDMLVEDYERARDIRRAASRPENSQTEQASAAIDDEQEDLLEPEPMPDENAMPPATPTALRIPETELPDEPQTSIEPQADDIEDMSTIQMSPLPEQQGHAFIEDFTTDEPASFHDEIEVVDDISSMETRFIEPQPIEYVDNDDVAIPHSPPPYSRREPARGAAHANQQEDNFGHFGRSNTAARRPHATGYVSPDKGNTNRPWQEALENDDDLPLEERATRLEEQHAPDHHAPSRTGREPRPVQLPIGVDLPAEAHGHGERGTARHLSKRGTMQRSQPLTAEQQVLQTPHSANVQPLRKARRQPILPNNASNRRQRDQRFGRTHRTRSTITTILIVLGLIAVIILLAFIIPTSTITLTLTTHTYDRPLTVTASDNATGDLSNQVMARTINQDFTRQGLEPVTGSKMIDTGLAQGNVCFSNSGTSAVTVPTNTIITTANGVQFKLTAESVFIAGTTCTTSPPDPIVAVQPGETSNVQAGAINTIPATSLDSIAHYNNTTVAKLAGLKVVNLNKTTGGGRQQVSAIASNDLQHARNDLHKQLQNDIDVWLKSLPNNGLAGQAMVTDALVNPPAVGTALSSNATTFQATVKVSVTVLFVDNNDLKAAAIPQIDTALKTDKTLQNYMVANNSIHAIQIRNAKIVGSTTSTLKISYTATARVVTNINAERIRQLSAGKTPDTARSAILAQIPGVTNVESNTDPVLFPTIAFWPAHVTVKLVPSNP